MFFSFFIIVFDKFRETEILLLTKLILQQHPAKKMIRNLLSIRSTAVSYCRCYARRSRNPSNPGIGKQMKALAEAPGKPFYPEDPEDYSHLESDFANVEQTHRSHKREEAFQRERTKHMIVRSKYFKETQLNFLTWAEKEQIRHLHQNDSEEWSAEKLADSFPADELTITKILRATWQPRSDERVRKHDEGVKRSWQALLDGSDIGGVINPKLRDHLMKFSTRGVVTDTERPTIGIKSLPIRKKTGNNEFLSIITSCKKYSEPEAAEQQTDKQVELPARPHNSDSFLLGKVNKSKPLMFKELTGITDDGNKRNDLKLRHNPFLDPRGEQAVTNAVPDSDVGKNQWHVQKYETSDVQSSEAELKKLSMPAIQDQISIPKALYRRGATYKLRDCYYDDDGEFLYRVPGMTGDN